MPSQITGGIEILRSVHAADAGVVINPMQGLGQIEDAVAQGIGRATAEHLAFTDDGRIINPSLRNYRIPAFADAPRAGIRFADIHGAVCPLGTKGMGECSINPVSPALANAIAVAASVSVRTLPCTPDRIHRSIFEQHGSL